MNPNQYLSNLFELSTQQTLYNAIIPTFVYTSQNLNSSLDFHYNCNLQIQQIPFYFEFNTLPTLEDNTKQLEKRN
jgi:hypothetical protein